MDRFVVQILPILFAVTLHEVAHGWVARRLGDPTAARLGRLSLNPLSHIDPVGTVLFPALQLILGGRVWFGWAKPVPVDPRWFKNPRRDMAMVALGGPAANLLQAVLAGLIVHGFLAIRPEIAVVIDAGAATATDRFLEPLFLMALYAVYVNIALMAFNLFPVPPLDGSRVALALLPSPLARRYARLEQYGLWIVMFLVAAAPRVIDAFVGPIQRVAFLLIGLH